MHNCSTIIRWGVMMILSLITLTLPTSCGKKASTPPYDLGDKRSEKITIPYKERDGVKTIPVKLNGVTVDMIYDTGCSGLHLSLHELQTLYKNGQLDNVDFLGTTPSQIADGSIVENGVINIRRLEIGEEDGLILENVMASVSPNQVAPVLLGNTVLDELASVEVDNLNKTINFIKK